MKQKWKELGGMLLYFKRYLKFSANHEKLGERPERNSLSWPSEGTNPANILILDIKLPEM